MIRLPSSIIMVLIIGASASLGQDSVEDRLGFLEAQNEQFRLDLEKFQSGDSGAAEGVSYKDLVKSGNPIKLYGFVRLDAYHNTARASSIIVPGWVLPEGAVIGGSRIEPNDHDFAFDARLTRLGLDFNAGQIGSATAKGKIEADFANFPPGVPESRATPRIRLAYVDVDWGEFSIRGGQDWDIISPLYPSVHTELGLWFAGNMGDRRPMFKGTWKPASGDSMQFNLATGLGLTGAVDNQDLDAGMVFGSERDGFDYGYPNLQMRAALEFKNEDGSAGGNIGTWGMIGGLETDLKFGGEDHFTTWTLGVDFTLPLTESVSVRGEQWFGQALGDFRGNIGQSINTVAGDEVQGWGGFGEIILKCDDGLKFHVGGSYDNPSNSDLTDSRLTTALIRERNWTTYAGLVKDWGGGLKTGFDTIFWRTDWIDEGVGDMYRYNAYIQLSF